MIYNSILKTELFYLFFNDWKNWRGLRESNMETIVLNTIRFFQFFQNIRDNIEILVFSTSNNRNLDPRCLFFLFAQILVGAVNMLTTVLALAIIDRVGRKKLVYWGVSGMVLSLLLIGTCFLTGERLGLPDGVLLAAFLCYVFCCAISVCAVVWVLLSEMYPIRVRGVAMSIAGFSLWTGTYLVGQLTPWMLANLTPAGTFFLFAAMCVPYMLLIWKAVPEMSGRTLEEIERYWTR